MRANGIFLALLALALTLPGRSSAAEPPKATKLQLTVSSCMADGSPEPAYTYQRSTLAETFSERLSVREQFAAKPVKTARWQAVPEGAEPRNHLSLVHVHLGDHHDFLALLHGGPRNSFRFAARAEALDVSGIKYWFGVPTGPRQMERNAPIDLIAHVANQYPGTEVKDEAPVVTLRLKLWSGQEDADAAGGGMPNEVPLPVLLPVFTAAACAAGLRPTFDETPDTLELRVKAAAGAYSYDVEATLTRQGTKQLRVSRRVAAADLFDTAQRLFLCLAHPASGILAIPHVADAPVRPRRLTTNAKGDPLVVLTEGDTLCARQPLSGEPAWSVPPPKGDRGDWSVEQATGSDGQVRFYTGRGELSQAINPQTGAGRPLPAAVNGVLALAELPTCTAVADATCVRLFADGKQLWQQDLKLPLCAGPALSEKAVYVGTPDGAVAALAAADGKAGWRVSLPESLCQPLTVLGDHLYGSTTNGTLLALRLADGTTAWQAALGDRLHQPLLLVDGHLLVVAGMNRLLLLDPATGGQVAERQWPTWLLTVAPVSAKNGRRLVCVDQRRTVSLLAWPSLATQREIMLPDRLLPSVLECPALPLPWGENSDMPDPKRVFLVGDERGYLTIFSLED